MCNFINKILDKYDFPEILTFILLFLIIAFSVWLFFLFDLVKEFFQQNMLLGLPFT